MKHLSKFILMIGLVFSGISIQAQTAIPATGGNASGRGGSVSYSVGQVAYTIASGSNGSVIQGVQQPYEISVVTGIEEKNIALYFSVYPNPATDYLILRIENIEQEKLSYWLFDIKGNLIGNGKIESKETEISMQSQHSGAYLLKVSNANKELKVFKIIKN